MFGLCWSYWLPKDGRSIDEYEDAFWPKGGGVRQAQELRFAVADGATESSYARQWARQLVAAYCNPAHPAPAVVNAFRSRVESRAADWRRHVFCKPLPWNVQAKAEQGASATLMGLTLCDDEQVGKQAEESGGGRWQAVAIGDSCVFQVRAGELLFAFPVHESKSFGYFPLLISSNLARNESVWAAFPERLATGDWRDGDLFVLATDALAHWFLSALEGGSKPWEILKTAASSQEEFAEFVATERAAQRMHNDDVTLLLIEPKEAA